MNSLFARPTGVVIALVLLQQHGELPATGRLT